MHARGRPVTRLTHRAATLCVTHRALGLYAAAVRTTAVRWARGRPQRPVEARTRRNIHTDRPQPRTRLALLPDRAPGSRRSVVPRCRAPSRTRPKRDTKANSTRKKRREACQCTSERRGASPRAAKGLLHARPRSGPRAPLPSATASTSGHLRPASAPPTTPWCCTCRLERSMPASPRGPCHAQPYARPRAQSTRRAQYSTICTCGAHAPQAGVAHATAQRAPPVRR